MSLNLPLLDLLCCPHDHASPLLEEEDALVCPQCSTRFPVRDGIVSFLSAQELSEQDHKERTQRDQESVWYDPMFEGYTNAVEIPTAVKRIGRPTGTILDAGCGTGRITEALVPLGQPIVAIDYSEACLRLMMKRTAGATVLPVQSDLRALPLRPEVIAAITCVEVYSQLRSDDRRKFLNGLRRVMRPGATLSISAFNYNLMFKAWQLLGNQGAREGEHMLGGDYYYLRFTRDEFRRELEAVFEVEELDGVRNIPARSIAQAIRRVGLRKAGDRFLDFMVEKGHQADFWLERTPLAGAVGFFWQAKATRRAPA
ncbi:MAG: methyltransferase domain-containing protein [Actinomycetota bacterium]|nr:methyltransferase domain-containing protein [Actinomycetota bacterium]